MMAERLNVGFGGKTVRYDRRAGKQQSPTRGRSVWRRHALPQGADYNAFAGIAQVAFPRLILPKCFP